MFLNSAKFSDCVVKLDDVCIFGINLEHCGMDATLEFFMTARGVILLVFYSYRVFPFEMETFDLEMMTSNFPIYAICGSIVRFLGK